MEALIYYALWAGLIVVKSTTAMSTTFARGTAARPSKQRSSFTSAGAGPALQY